MTDAAGPGEQPARGRRITKREKIDDAELRRHGIERVPADVYLWGGYRYSNARDALAAAKRNAAS